MRSSSGITPRCFAREKITPVSSRNTRLPLTLTPYLVPFLFFSPHEALFNTKKEGKVGVFFSLYPFINCLPCGTLLTQKKAYPKKKREVSLKRRGTPRKGILPLSLFVLEVSLLRRVPFLFREKSLSQHKGPSKEVSLGVYPFFSCAKHPSGIKDTL